MEGLAFFFVQMFILGGVVAITWFSCTMFSNFFFRIAGTVVGLYMGLRVYESNSLIYSSPKSHIPLEFQKLSYQSDFDKKLFAIMGDSIPVILVVCIILGCVTSYSIYKRNGNAKSKKRVNKKSVRRTKSKDIVESSGDDHAE